MRTEKEAFSERLKDYLERKHMTLGTLSYRTGINRRTLYEYRYGRTAPNLPQLKKLAEGTGISADWWIGAKI